MKSNKYSQETATPNRVSDRHTTAIPSPSTSLFYNNSNSAFLSPSPNNLQIPFSTLHHSNIVFDDSSLEILNSKLKLLENEMKKRQQETTEDNGEMKEAVSIVSDEDSCLPGLRWCAHCKRELHTKIVYRPTQKTLWSSIGILLAGGIFGCFLIPYMSESCQEANMVCSKCIHSLK